MHLFRNASLAALLILLATTTHATTNTTTPVTTDDYSSSSSSEDIAESCKSVKIHKSKGEVTATCNEVITDDHISYWIRTVDLDDYIYCPNGGYGINTSLTWGNTSSQRVTVNWNVKKSSDGDDYIVEGQCYLPAGWLSTKSSLDLSDGLKNNGGKLEKK